VSVYHCPYNFTSPQFIWIIKVLGEQAGGGPLHNRHNTQT